MTIAINIIPEVVSFLDEYFDEKENEMKFTEKTASVIAMYPRLIPTEMGVNGEDFFVICFDKEGIVYEKLLNTVRIIKSRKYEIGTTRNFTKKRRAGRTKTAKRNNNTGNKENAEDKRESAPDRGGNEKKANGGEKG